MEPRYLFGTNSAAAGRLELLARVFQESTRAFLRVIGDGGKVMLAVDLGCGPGLTTRLLAETLDCGRVVGLDSSPEFIESARRSPDARVDFALHDVCAAPFPYGKAGLIFCRFLLTHLLDPEAAAEIWATQMDHGGLLMIEETEAIRTERPVFLEYLAIVKAMLARNSNRLYAGRLLADMRPRSLTLAHSDIRSVPVDNAEAAAMFALNMNAWKESNFVRANYSGASIAKLEHELKSIADRDAGVCGIRWAMRQSVFAKLENR